MLGVCSPCERRFGNVEMSVSADLTRSTPNRGALLSTSLAVRSQRDGTLVRREQSKRAADARSRLVTAILHLLETRDADFLTVDVMVRAAKLSRTTFYRLFPDRECALHAAADRMLADVLAGLPRLDAPLGDAEPERLRGWVAGLLDELTRRSRAWRTGDERWRRLVLADLEQYVARLREARLVRCEAPQTIAAGVVYVLDGVLAQAGYLALGEPDTYRVLREAEV
jgi:AcrR family transcriptional regulator